MKEASLEVLKRCRKSYEISQIFAEAPEIVDSIQLLAETEGIFTETAGGVTLGCARKLYKSDRILPHETTVLCITGNGLKTTDVLTGEYQAEQPIPAKLTEFEKLFAGEFELPAAVGA